MKKLLALCFALYLFLPVINAQDDEIRPPAIGISFILNDFKTAQNIRSTSLVSTLTNKKWSKVKDMSPGLALTYFKGLKKHLDFAGSVEGSFVSNPLPNRNFSSAEFLLAADATLNFKMVSEAFWVQPYLIGGVGAMKYRKYWGAFMPVGLGMKVNLWDESHLFITSQYRLPITTETSNYHFFYSFGVAGALTKKKEKVIPPPPPPPPPPPADTDGDGITDDKDKCPTVKGIAKYDGCPIPDTDKDGINDEEDKCPTVPGLAKYNGCPIPDTDKDGINDEEDKCPTVPGVARYQGCPIPDSDNDGVNDEEDKCPNLAGPASNQGCPVISEEIRKIMDSPAANVLFETGSAKLQRKSIKGLNNVVRILQENPDMKLALDGHTDDVDAEDKNQILSENRAAAVKAFFVSKQIAEDRITTTGHGEMMPTADNKTAAGRQKNRRVELKVSY